MKKLWITEIIELASQGFTYKEIAEQAGVTEQTIKNIAHRFFRDEGFKNITHAVAESIRKGQIK